MQRPRIAVLASAVSAASGGVGIGGVAQAQDQLEEVVVTGSRIARRDFSAASPIMTVDAERFQNSSTLSVDSVLNQLPQFVPAGSQFTNTDVEPSAFNSPGISSVNLRGLGANRNLVLVNGRRPQPANATLVVDVNTIPSSAIASVEVITGGASAVYGADAISGVVNFRLRDDFQGLDLDIQSGTTAEGDGQESSVSVLFGADLGSGRGNVMLGGSMMRREAVYERNRDWKVAGWLDPGTTGSSTLRQTAYNPPTNNAPSQAAFESVFGVPAGTPGVLNNYYVGDGDIFQAQGALGYDGPLGLERKILSTNGDLVENNTNLYLSSPLDRYSAFGHATYDVSDNVSAFFTGNFSAVEVSSVLDYAPAITFWSARIPRGPEYPVSPELATLLDSRPNPGAPWELERWLDFIGPRGSENTTTVYQLQTGFEGSLPGRDWTWEAFVAHGQTNVNTYLNSGFASLQRYLDVVQAPNYGEGFQQDGAVLGFRHTCTTGLPILETFTPSEDCVDAIEGRMKAYTQLDQSIMEANLQGGLIDMPSGELRFAAGVSYRENDFWYEPDTLADAESVLDGPIGIFPSNNTAGTTDVAEIYGELLVPVVSRLNIELGYRHSDYNTAGGQDTYKALFDWAPVDAVRLRGGRQIANRAPNTAELFTGPSLAVESFPGADPCLSITANSWGNLPSNPDRAEVQALCSALIGNPTSDFDLDPDNYVGPFGFFQLEIAQIAGNADLLPEEAETYTFGVVFQRDNWDASVDYYSVDISNAISPINALTVYEKCFNADGVSNPSYSLNDPGGFCQLIDRFPADGSRAQVRTPYYNLGALETSGVDAQVNWRGERFYVNALVNYLHSFKEQGEEDAPPIEYAGTLGAGGQFDYRLFTTAGYNLSSVNLGVRWRYLPEIESAGYALDPETLIEPVESYSVFDFFGNWAIRDDLLLRFGIDNLFNEEPNVVGYNPGVNNARGSTNAGYYDTLGRRMYLGLKISF